VDPPDDHAPRLSLGTGALEEDLTQVPASDLMAQALGHASPQVTRSIYLHALPASADRVTALIDQLLPIHPADGSDEEALRSDLLSLRVRRQGYLEPATAPD
jgi:hypothetical protein